MAAIYARVSSEQQREENTIASQTASLIEFAKGHNVEVPEGDARALWLPGFDGVAATRGLEGECETHLRLYTQEQLIVRTKQRRKMARRQRVARPMAVGPNQSWSMDLMSDRLADGRSFRILTVVDQFTRECVGLEADRAMTGMKVAQALQRAKVERGSLPATITVDNGSEFCSRALEAWGMGNGVQLCFIRPCRPVENGFIESFNGRLRDEFLNVEWFVSLDDAREAGEVPRALQLRTATQRIGGPDASGIRRAG
jgi:transposase InsO family protein